MWSIWSKQWYWIQVSNRTAAHREPNSKDEPVHTREGQPCPSTRIQAASSPSDRTRNAAHTFSSFLQMSASPRLTAIRNSIPVLCFISLSILQSFRTTATLFSSVRCSSGTKMRAPTASKAVTHQLLAKNHENEKATLYDSLINEV